MTSPRAGAGILTVWFTQPEICSVKAESRDTRRGQPCYSELAITTALTLRAVFRLALRQTSSAVGDLQDLRNAFANDNACRHSIAGRQRGIMDASAIRRLLSPYTLSSPSTTDIASRPILAVPLWCQ
jgi:hypothetical protein